MTNKEERAFHYYLNFVRILGREYQRARDAYAIVYREHIERFQEIIDVFANGEEIDLIRYESSDKTSNLAILALQIAFLRGRIESANDVDSQDLLKYSLKSIKAKHREVARMNCGLWRRW